MQHNHEAALKQRHQALDRMIAVAEHQPSADDLTIRRLKKNRLKIKDELFGHCSSSSFGVEGGRIRPSQRRE